MRIWVKARTGAKEEKVVPPALRLFNPTSHEATRDDAYTVSVKERPVEGRANEAITRLLAEHFHVPRSHVRLVSGAIAKRKVFEIQD
jgi:hypothetical protein